MFSLIIFSKRLYSLRSAAKLTLEQLGNELGVTRSALGNLEHGRKKPSLELVIALAQFFEVSVDYLLGLSDDPKRR